MGIHNKHSNVVVSTVTPQQQGYASKQPAGWGLSVLSLHVLPVTVGFSRVVLLSPTVQRHAC